MDKIVLCACPERNRLASQRCNAKRKGLEVGYIRAGVEGQLPEAEHCPNKEGTTGSRLTFTTGAKPIDRNETRHLCNKSISVSRMYGSQVAKR